MSLVFEYPKGCTAIENIGKMKDILDYRDAFTKRYLLADNVFG